MDRWFGKVAVVTGASSGIGAAIAIDLVNAGMKVVGLARRVELVAELKNCIAKESKGKLFPLKCDVTNETEVRSIFKWIEENLGGVDVMINNAGILRKVNLVDLDNTNAIREIVDTNIMGYVYCTREAFHSMKKRNVSGHIILMNSIAGHKVIYSVGSLPSFNIYTPTKYAITAMTEILRQELIAMGTKIKITVNIFIYHLYIL